MNFKIPTTTIPKNYMLIAGAIILCILVAAGAYFGLRTVAPRGDDATIGQNADGLPATNIPIATQADAAFKAGSEALKAGKTEEAITHLNTAKKLYEQAGDTTKVEQTADVISYAENEAKVEAEHGQTQGQAQEQGSASQSGTGQGEANTGGSGDLNGNGIIDNGEQAPPENVTVEGDKATTER